MGFSKQALAAECRILGPQVKPLPAGVDGAQLLWALAGVESSFGQNTKPRHEPAYDVGGRYDNAVMQPLLERWGSAAACSYGPLQIMLVNAPGYVPADFDDLPTAMRASLSFLNRQLRSRKPQTLAEIGQVWNSGRIASQPSAAVQDYIRKLTASYAVAMPSDASGPGLA